MVKVCSTKLMRLTRVTYDIKEVNEIPLCIVIKGLRLLKDYRFKITFGANDQIEIIIMIGLY